MASSSTVGSISLDDSKTLSQFVDAIKNEDPDNSGELKIWIDPWAYQNMEQIASAKIPKILRQGQNDSGIKINTGILSTFNIVFDTFKKNGVKLGTGASALRVSVWIKPLVNRSYENSFFHSNILVWSPTKA